MKAQLHPNGIERQYRRALHKYIKDLSSVTQRELKSRNLYKLDGFSEDLTMLIDAIMYYMQGHTNALVLRLPDVYALVNRWHDREWRLVVKAGTGLSIPSSNTLPPQFRDYGNISSPEAIRARLGVGIDIYRDEPWLAKLQSNWIAQNTSLIKSIPTQHMAKVEVIVRNGVMNGTSPREIARQVAAAGDVTLRRGTVIARDQISKANAQLTEWRQKEAGVKSYRWRTSLDERVRPTHRANEGKIVAWDKPPANTGHVGHDVMCRCHAEPIFANISS